MKSGHMKCFDRVVAANEPFLRSPPPTRHMSTMDSLIKVICCKHDWSFFSSRTLLDLLFVFILLEESANLNSQFADKRSILHKLQTLLNGWNVVGHLCMFSSILLCEIGYWAFRE